MRPRVKISGKRFFVIADFQHLQKLKKAIKVLQGTQGKPQLSILGRLGNDDFFLDSMEMHLEQELEAYWNEVLKAKTDFGFFINPELGTLFVAGPMASQFLSDISGEPLGTMAAGPYGILRGLDINEDKVNYYLKLLKDGHYLLFVRTSTQQWELIQEQLGKLK